MVTIKSSVATHRIIIKDIKLNKYKMVSFISDKPLGEIYDIVRRTAEEL